MSKADIRDRLIALSVAMAEIGTAMDYYGGFADWGKHAQELIDGSMTVREWAWAMDKEERDASA